MLHCMSIRTKVEPCSMQRNPAYLKLSSMDLSHNTLTFRSAQSAEDRNMHNIRNLLTRWNQQPPSTDTFGEYLTVIDALNQGSGDWMIRFKINSDNNDTYFVGINDTGNCFTTFRPTQGTTINDTRQLMQFMEVYFVRTDNGLSKS